jgi:hypothetical protein
MLARHVIVSQCQSETICWNLLSKPTLGIMLIFELFLIGEEIRQRSQLNIPKEVLQADFSSMN